MLKNQVFVNITIISDMFRNLTLKKKQVIPKKVKL